VDLEVVMGSLGCGDLLYELREQFQRAGPEEVVRVVSDDPGAGVEIPAWCRMTGHTLLSMDHPFYIIRVRPGGA
jgi:tRNA 2-thiouridine synthesizing protein A